MQRPEKGLLSKAVRWFTGDSFYNFEADYLRILTSEDRINKLINSYLFYTNHENS